MWPSSLAANDSAASVAVGGIVLTRQPNISMESEPLTISLGKITVEYEFLNESDADISTEVAFPIPAYEYTEDAGGIRAFNDFRLWVDGQPLKYEVEAKAFLVKRDDHDKVVGQPRDVTAILNKYSIDIPSLGHFIDAEDYKVPDFDKLPPASRKVLSAQGLVDAEPGHTTPQWEVRKTYHWKQTYPAHKVLESEA